MGEGPASLGQQNSLISWVDIYDNKVLWQNLLNATTGSFDVADQVGFALPRKDEGWILGIGDQLVLRDHLGNEESIGKCYSSETGVSVPTPVRWNDAKVAPNGELFAGSMPRSGESASGSLYRISDEGRSIQTLLTSVGISNGLDWNVGGDKFFYIDTRTYRVDRFNYSEKGISDREEFIKFDPEGGLPDGMCMDIEDGLWIAFCGGGRIERYTSEGKLSEVIEMPIKNVTSCCFGGELLDQLFVTSAFVTEEDNPQSGMTFTFHPGVTGKKTAVFN